MDRSSYKKDTVTLKIEIPRDIYSSIKERAEEKKLTLKEYAILKMTDEVGGREALRREIITNIPVYYNKVREIVDQDLRGYFVEFGGFLCRL